MRMTPRATYRMQFHKDFGFDEAARLAPYLAKLGVSHLYASPYLKAHPGSTHGYDIVDHDQFNPELGGEAGFERLVAALSDNGLRHILDFVPNHMGVGGADNSIWLDLLEWGEEADHAGWFDVDWTPDRVDLRGKVLVPLLGKQYGVTLEAGDLVLKYDSQDGSFAVWAHDTHKLPICPIDYEDILGHSVPALEVLGDAFSDLLQWRPQIMRRARDLKSDLARLAMNSAAVNDAIKAALHRLNGVAGNEASWAMLDALIKKQRWKVTHFLVAGDDINYRRFFNIATLAGLRMELPDVFDHTHRLVLRLMREDKLDGLRIDHIDGLYDPKGYLQKLRNDAPLSRDGSLPYLVVEKILGHDEPLRDDWPIDGTTGYDFTNLLTGLFVQARHEGKFTRFYDEFLEKPQSFDAITHKSKLKIIDDEMSSELHRMARAATRVARENNKTTDFTFTVLQRAIRAIVAAFPVYRTYIDGTDEPTAEDLRYVDIAIAAATKDEPSIDPSVFAFLQRLLSGNLADGPWHGYRRSDVYRCAMTLQQYCGPVMAKGVEDTAFYRYYRFVALNEVGGSPDRFGISLGAFHEANRQRIQRWPTTMLATSTHDTKRGEDTRARLAALSNLPDEWSQKLQEWQSILGRDSAPCLRPDRNDEYLFYQLLVGTWPADFIGQDKLPHEGLTTYVDRLKAVMRKSFREAKTHSTWVAPDEAYETEALAFVDAALVGPRSEKFLASLRPFVDQVARSGAEVTFAQTVLKFAVPGMPDVYQGAELWDLSMVDPDNRRPIDFTARATALDTILEQAGGASAALGALWRDWHDGRFKLALTALLLDQRRAHPDVFMRGSYTAIATGTEDLCAFERRFGDVRLIVLANRFPSAQVDVSRRLVLTADLQGTTARNLLNGRDVGFGADIDVAMMMDGLPAAVLMIGAT
ncbi:malto-oligosyltrehalose synthase [Lichenihabitans sp. PAMC28606]|uniref:malto-oligosyltrehalose synthase n=1 Tax=Lichenihabitans sp. PAMC28606 TaxID=2880932 RepID=UPI001D0B73E6|nr:malto-oligosyltrehalose synthase [Lichenihabitans sp. PAMC28606]UDL94715.1 malto-oligosyltrehalose synthase [Lichenihabitans sp. PAMC28606]